MVSRQRIWQIQIWQKLKLTFPKRCFDCGICPLDIEDLEFAHIKETNLSGMGRGFTKKYYDIIHNPDSYILCCKIKHSEIDNKNYYVKNEILQKIIQVKNVKMI